MRVVRAVAAVGALIAVMTWCAPAAFALPDVVGKTYDDAVSVLQGSGHTVIVASTFGSRLPRSECIVTSVTDHKMLRPAGDENFYEYGWGEVQVSLNCNGGYANAIHPGSSLGSPEGRKARDYEDEVQWRSENPDWCEDAMRKHPEWGEMDGCTYE